MGRFSLKFQEAWIKPHWDGKPYKWSKPHYDPHIPRSSGPWRKPHVDKYSVGSAAGLDKDRSKDSTGKGYGLEKGPGHDGDLYLGPNHFNGGQPLGGYQLTGPGVIKRPTGAPRTGGSKNPYSKAQMAKYGVFQQAAIGKV